jgi:HSP20 family protein
MAKYTTNPWLEIQGMKEKMDQLMDEVHERFDLHQKVQESKAHWHPVTDVYESSTEYVIQMELAGLDKEEIELEIKDRQLRIFGQRRMIKDVRGSRYHILERSYGPFARKFSLPRNVCQDDIQASFQSGLLTITVPKSEKTQEHKAITVTEE